jgi:RNA polymerase sigma factor (sigma-70 family)
MKQTNVQQSLPWPIGSTQYKRIQELASRMLSEFPVVRQTDDTCDVAHSAMIRLSAALQEIEPESELHFWRLVALAIRRTLFDVARRSRKVLPIDLPLASPSGREVQHRANWAEFHERVAEIPEVQREILELHWYAGLTQQQAAELLDVDIRTVQRRWRSARLSLHRILFECVPTSAMINVPRNGRAANGGE